MTRWCRSLLADISCLPIQVVVIDEVEEVSVYNVTVQGIPEDSDEVESAGQSVDSDSEDEEAEVDSPGWPDTSSVSSESGSSVHYTDSIEDLVGEDWLIHEGWAASSG